MSPPASRTPAVVVPSAAPNAYGIIRSLARRRVPVLALDHQPTPLRRSRLCRFRVVPDPDRRPAEFIRSLLEIAASLPERPVLFPTQDLHATLVQQHRAELEPAFRFPFMPLERFLECVDKRRMLSRAAAAGLTVPETHCPATSAELAARLGGLRRYPYIIKPAAKFEWQGDAVSRNMAFFRTYGTKALRADGPRELMRLFEDARSHDFTVLVQEEIEGPTERLSAIDFYADPAGRILAWHTGRKLRQYPADFGTCTLGRSMPVDSIVGPCRDFVAAVGFHGLGNMEFKERDGRQYLMEINPRAWMWIGLATAAGVNLPWLAYADLSGRPAGPSTRVPRSLDWIDLRVDCLHLTGGAVPPREAVGIGAWLRSLGAARVEARSTPADPGPIVDAVVSAAGRRAMATGRAVLDRMARWTPPPIPAPTPPPIPAPTPPRAVSGPATTSPATLPAGLRVTFVLPDFPHFAAPYGGTFAHGLASMAAVLRNAGHEVSLLHIVRPPTRREFVDRLRATRPDVIGFSSITHFFPIVRSWIGWARSVAAAPIVVGGIHAILCPDEVMAVPEVDFVCTGEGEYTLLELCRRIAAGQAADDVTGTWSRNGDGSVRENPPRPLIEDLNELPFPDYSLFDYPRLYDGRNRRLAVMVSRGCPYRCAYCANARIRLSYPNPRHYSRFLAPERAVEHLARLVAAHPAAESLVFNDNILYGSQSWLEEFASLYRKRIGLPFVANMRPGNATASAAPLLKAAGCRLVCLGVECGDEEIANRVLRRDLTNGAIERAFQDFQSAGIDTVANGIVGSPFETRETLWKTVRFISRLRPTLTAPFIFYPFPGTECHQVCLENGFLTGRHGRHNGDRVMIRQPTVRDLDVLFIHRYFHRLVRLYEWLDTLPAGVGRPLERSLDRALRSRYLPRRLLLLFRHLYSGGRRLILAAGTAGSRRRRGAPRAAGDLTAAAR